MAGATERAAYVLRRRERLLLVPKSSFVGTRLSLDTSRSVYTRCPSPISQLSLRHDAAGKDSPQINVYQPSHHDSVQMRRDEGEGAMMIKSHFPCPGGVATRYVDATFSNRASIDELCSIAYAIMRQ